MNQSIFIRRHAGQNDTLAGALSPRKYTQRQLISLKVSLSPSLSLPSRPSPMNSWIFRRRRMSPLMHTARTHSLLYSAILTDSRRFRNSLGPRVREAFILAKLRETHKRLRNPRCTRHTQAETHSVLPRCMMGDLHRRDCNFALPA